MMFKLKSYKSDDKVKGRVLNRLRNSTTSEVIRWGDNVLTGTGTAFNEMQKSLRQNNPEQALVYVEEIRNGALSLLAAAQVLEERVTE